MSAPNPHPTNWVVTSRGGAKRVHRTDCRYAKTHAIYAVLGFRSEADAAQLIIEWGGWSWHDGCRVCCPSLDDAMVYAGVRPVVKL